MSIQYEHTTLTTNGVDLHVVQAGPEDGPLVILLHGFPEFWYSWRNQIPALAEAGLRVMAPDQRGYNTSDKPKGLDAYTMDQIALDVVGLIDTAGRDKVFLVGHDWGGAIAWWVANKHPERLHKLVILNTPHHAVFSKNLRGNKDQRRRSRYMVFFQLPLIPELVMRFGATRRALVRTSKVGTFPDEVLTHYQQAWRQRGALTAMLNWYRAVRRRHNERPKSLTIEVPTLILWGKHDVAFVPESGQQSLAYCADGRIVEFEGTSHWIAVEEPERVNAELVSFLTEKA